MDPTRKCRRQGPAWLRVSPRGTRARPPTATSAFTWLPERLRGFEGPQRPPHPVYGGQGAAKSRFRRETRKLTLPGGTFAHSWSTGSRTCAVKRRASRGRGERRSLRGKSKGRGEVGVEPLVGAGPERGRGLGSESRLSARRSLSLLWKRVFCGDALPPAYLRYVSNSWKVKV